MLTHNGWSAWISVDGQELPQYQTTVKEEVSGHPIARTMYKVSCWIASEEGKEFRIHTKAIPGIISTQNKFSVRPSLDGTSVTGRFMESPSDLQVNVTGNYCQASRTETPFLFSGLTLTDDDSALRDVSHLKDLGIITVEVNKAVLVGESLNFLPIKNQSVAAKGPIHEASKKAGAHCVSFGKPKPVALGNGVQTKLAGGPTIVFEFRYRSVDMLRAQGIVPPLINPESKEDVAPVSRQPKRRVLNATAGPSSLKRKMKRETDNEENVDAEIDALKERLNALERKRDKENNSEGSTRSKKKAKVEPLDNSNFIDGEVIDLT